MNREIKFRIWNGMEMVYDITVGRFGVFYVNPENGDGLNPKDKASLTTNTTKCYEGTPLMQFTGLKDKNGVDIYEGDIISFWACYPTTQTHTGNNIPNGSYTEPDETVFEKIQGLVEWDDDRAKFSFSILSKPPYQFQNYFNFYWNSDQIPVVPIIDRCEYELDYIKWTYGYEGMSDDEWNEYLSDAGFSSENEMMDEINAIEVIGNIQDNPRLLTK